MDIQLHRRAEIALRSLQPGDRVRASNAIRELSNYDGGTNPNIRRIKIETSSESELFIFRITGSLRAVFTIENDAIKILDISNAEKIHRLSRRSA